MDRIPRCLMKSSQEGNQGDSEGGRVAVEGEDIIPPSHGRRQQPLHVPPKDEDNSSSANSSILATNRLGSTYQGNSGGRHGGSRVTGAGARKGDIVISTSASVSYAAAPLSHVLRKDGRAKVRFNSGRGLLKALKAFAITHDFLSQHACTLSLCPISINETSLPLHAAEDDMEERRAPGHWERRRQPFPSSSAAAIPRQEFVCEVWHRRCERMEVDLRPQSNTPLYDFALDSRREWKSKTGVGMDMAYSLADMFYGQLITVPCQEGKEIPSVHIPLPPPPPRRPSPSFPHLPGAWSGPFLLTADMAQSSTLFTALALFQRRLLLEGTPLKVMVTIFRNDVAPRIDGRNGFVFKVHLSSSLTGPPTPPAAHRKKRVVSKGKDVIGQETGQKRTAAAASKGKNKGQAVVVGSLA